MFSTIEVAALYSNYLQKGVGSLIPASHVTLKKTRASG